MVYGSFHFSFPAYRTSKKRQVPLLRNWSQGSTSLWGSTLGVDLVETQKDVAVIQNQWYYFGVGAPPILVFSVGIGMFNGGTGF